MHLLFESEQHRFRNEFFTRVLVSRLLSSIPGPNKLPDCCERSFWTRCPFQVFEEELEVMDGSPNMLSAIRLPTLIDTCFERHQVGFDIRSAQLPKVTGVGIAGKVEIQKEPQVA